MSKKKAFEKWGFAAAGLVFLATLAIAFLFRDTIPDRLSSILRYINYGSVFFGILIALLSTIDHKRESGGLKRFTRLLSLGNSTLIYFCIVALIIILGLWFYK